MFSRWKMFTRWQHAHQFDVSLTIQHEVLRLQISVEDTLAMEVIESFCDATNAEFGSGLIKTPPKDMKAKFKLFAEQQGQIWHHSVGREAGEVVSLHKSNWTTGSPYSMIYDNWTWVSLLQDRISLCFLIRWQAKCGDFVTFSMKQHQWHQSVGLLPVSEQTPNLSTQTGLQQHVHIFVIFKRAIQSGVREAQTS